MCSAITKRSCKRGHTRSVGARDTVRAVRGRRAWSCEAHLRTYAPSLASICFRQRVARSSLLDDPLKWRSAARYTCATFLGLFSRICTVGGYEVGIAQECLVPPAVVPRSTGAPFYRALPTSPSQPAAQQTSLPRRPHPPRRCPGWPHRSGQTRHVLSLGQPTAVADPTAALFEAAPGWSHGTAATAPAGLAPMAWKDCAQPMHRMSARTGGKE